jgi:hypothetical protein
MVLLPHEVSCNDRYYKRSSDAASVITHRTAKASILLKNEIGHSSGYVWDVTIGAIILFWRSVYELIYQMKKSNTILYQNLI